MHFATVGWILPKLHDPDGHEVRFYTMDTHTDVDPAAPLIVEDAVASAHAKEEEWLARQSSSADTGEAPDEHREPEPRPGSRHVPIG